MGTVIYRGSTPTIKFKPLNNVSVGDLGEPSIAITQELVFVNPENIIIDAATNTISAKLTEEETLSLVEGVETTAQEVWKLSDGSIIRYPLHKLSVAPTLIEEFDPTPEPEPPATLENMHPFFAYTPFTTESGFWQPYGDDGGTAVEQWAEDYPGPSSLVTDGVMEYDTSEKESLRDIFVIPTCAYSMEQTFQYYLWVKAESSNTVTFDMDAGAGYSVSTIDGEETSSFTLQNSDKLLLLTSEESSFNQPLFKMRVRESLGSTVRLTMALYTVNPDIPESQYKQYLPFGG